MTILLFNRRVKKMKFPKGTNKAVVTHLPEPMRKMKSFELKLAMKNKVLRLFPDSSLTCFCWTQTEIHFLRQSTFNCKTKLTVKTISDQRSTHEFSELSNASSFSEWSWLRCHKWPTCGWHFRASYQGRDVPAQSGDHSQFPEPDWLETVDFWPEVNKRCLNTQTKKTWTTDTRVL